MDNEQLTDPTESTPLLHTAAPARNLPSISQALFRVQVHDHDIDTVCSSLSLPSIEQETAFRLILLLLVYLDLGKKRELSSSEIWDQWSHDIALSQRLRSLDERILHVWEHYLQEYRSSRSIQQVLWTEFQDEDRSIQCFRGMCVLVRCITKS
jgi:hypothetical protein